MSVRVRKCHLTDGFADWRDPGFAEIGHFFAELREMTAVLVAFASKISQVSGTWFCRKTSLKVEMVI
jgi:hypothetical protein